MADTPYTVGRNLCRCPGACTCAPWAIFNRRGGVYATYMSREAAAFVATLLNTPPYPDPLQPPPEPLEAPPEPLEVPQAPAPGAGLQDHQIAGLVSAVTAALHREFDGCDCDGVLPRSAREVVRQAVLAYLEGQSLRITRSPVGG
jgi:hypothetical protein